MLSSVFFLSANAEPKNEKLTPFQKNLKACLQDDIDVKLLNTMRKTYEAVSKKYLLLSSVVIGREVLYKIKDENRKLKYEDGKIRLFRVVTTEDDRLEPVDNEVRQKSLTVESYLTQLLIHADIRYDWMKSRETRSGSTFVDITTVDSEFKSLVVEREKSKKKLECNRSDSSDICTCSEMK